MSTETVEGSKVESSGDHGDPPPPLELDKMRRQMEEQFNNQRARMKELFLQKEEEMQHLKEEKEQLSSEVVGLRTEIQQLEVLSANQRSEIQSLQMLVSETVEASSSGSEECRRLRARCAELEHALQQMRLQMHQIQQQEVSLVPATLVRTLRKLGGDDDQPSPRKTADESELQSIIQPLEQEIAVLKTKLRDTDTQLQEALKSNQSSSQSTVGDSKADASEAPKQCDMCINYEKQLVTEQANADAARERSAKLDQALRLATEELEGVRSIHDETVRSWNESRASSAALLDELRAAVHAADTQLKEKCVEAQESSRRALELVTTLTVDRETLQRKLNTLERDNAVLMGQFTDKVEDMQNEVIDLPDTVEALQEHILQIREQLIECAIGREQALADESDLRSQLLQQGALFHSQEAALANTRVELREAKELLDRLQTEREQMKELGDKLRHSNDMIEQLLADKSRLQTEVMAIRQRVSVLQQELDNSEKVQQDFVRLSQSLQVQLQRIREADTEVRWQHEEDVTECPECRAPLSNNKKKVHCRHCGRIFCASCVSHTVASGPRGAPARVCSVCRTLLQPLSAPYFSTHVPHTPD